MILWSDDNFDIVRGWYFAEVSNFFLSITEIDVHKSALVIKTSVRTLEPEFGRRKAE